MKLTPGDLKALTAFLDGLAELTAKTGVKACPFGVEHVGLPGGQFVQIDYERTGDGPITYHVDDRS